MFRTIWFLVMGVDDLFVFPFPRLRTSLPSVPLDCESVGNGKLSHPFQVTLIRVTQTNALHGTVQTTLDKPSCFSKAVLHCYFRRSKEDVHYE